jgi:predicted alpha-1,2-mannosidase
MKKYEPSKISLFILLTVLALFLGFCAKAQYTSYVNPFIGTGGHGHTYPGATLPHGMVQLSPDTRLTGWDGCSGYHYSDTFIYGFTHTHLSGTGCSDYGDILLMPGSGTPSPINTEYGSSFSHKYESANPGFYNVKLNKNNIYVQLTATERVGYHHYIYTSKKQPFVVLDLEHRDEVLESSLRIEDSFTVSGLRRSKAWANNQYVYFVMKFSSPIVQHGIWQNDYEIEKQIDKASGKKLKAYFYFSKSMGHDLYVKVAISPVSVDGAKRNMEAEIGNQNFYQIRNEANRKWEKELSKIEVKTYDTEKLKVFYTALYHTAIVPNINMDVDGQYRGMDDKIHKAEDFTYYSVFSLWDTYRATHPLYTIIDRQRTSDYIKTFLTHYQQGGQLPIWELSSCETDCMIGNHSIPVILDAYQKGITDFDVSLAWKAMMSAVAWDHEGMKAHVEKGVIGVEDDHESVSKCLEYAYNDYCIGEFARLSGISNDWKKYYLRAQQYKNLYDAETGFMRPRQNGGWINPFDPREVNNHFTEANSWQYSFYFPQDMEGYIEMIGGKKKLEKKLDALFKAPSKTTGRDQSDITGLIGQYAHGNEPSHHIAYLYNYTDHPEKTQSTVHRIMNDFYKNSPDGLIGNEDCGQMSAWYVMSALGFYPVTPGSGKYLLGSPQFPLAEIHLENGKSFVINAPEASTKNPYIRQIQLSTSNAMRPVSWNNPFLFHDDIASGGLVSFFMHKNPSPYFSTLPFDSSLSEMSGKKLVVNPVIQASERTFSEKMKVTISSPLQKVKIWYTTDEQEPNEKMNLYSGPIEISKTTTIKAVAINDLGQKSFVTTSSFVKRENDWAIQLNSKYESQYAAGGAEGLIDGLRGTENWRMGNWQGYQLQPFEAVIDLKATKDCRKVEIGFLQDTRAWIVMPKSLKIELSIDGQSFKEVYNQGPFLPIEDLTTQVKKLEALFEKQQARYIKIKAEQFGKLPNWHEGAGGDTHIFVDEIEVE